MDARDLVRSVMVFGSGQGMRALRSAWRRRRVDAAGLPRQRAERARTPGEAAGAEPGPGGGVIRFARSALYVRVTVGGAVFLGWDGAGPEPSYALAGPCPEPDPRARLEPDKDGGWRVVSERMLVVVSRHGSVEVRTPGGALLRRDLPPRWWECEQEAHAAEDARSAKEARLSEEARSAEHVRDAERAGSEGGARWMQRSELPPDARFFGLGGRGAGPRLREGVYRLWNTDPGSFGPDEDPLYITMPVLLSVVDAGTLLVFHDNSWDGSVSVREGTEGLGSGHDRPARCEVRMSGGPMRYWLVAGAPSRVLHGWAALTGAPALPPRWALGHQHARWGFGSEREVRRVAEGYRSRGLPLRALHLDIDHYRGHRVFTVDERRFPDLPRLAAELLGHGVRLVSIVDPGVKAERGYAVYDSGTAADVFVRDARGREVVGVAWPGDTVFPDFTDRRVRKWWGELYAERLAQGFAGVWHDMNEPAVFTPFGTLADRTLPLSARHALEGRGGDHREAHNVYALTMAKAGYAGLRELRPERRPFLFSRSGWAGMQRYGGTWSGDVETGWEGLRASLSLVLGLGLCGVPYSGPDVGGFTGHPSPELYLRWFQLGAYLPLFRTHAAKWAGRREPWEFGADVLEHARAALEERERLTPYFVTLAQLAHRTGAPYVRPVWWQHPRDRALRDCEDAFLLGDALLVAPVLEQGIRTREVRLPSGRWYDTATGRAYEGPRTVRLATPGGRVPVLARAGAAVPVRGADGGTELEVWPPAPGRTGSGLVIPDPGEGWERPEAERFTVRGTGNGGAVVEREGGGAVGYAVRVRTVCEG
ncbi:MULTISPECIES: TIM-barrel domain-containing protein [unclassified Streptomyces]|uniref:glycoside hydrolase family 31 protein n=1 Tax=unclassified Streptomyces TaxID=2593676 RepID=UPI002DDABA95|nr:TIM-barrel domain-containing protein [Streptomyces sp. NBC_01775]WSB80955.1 glycosyl hydrolase [Streptomyces sp. NBC_01775]WSS39533.1 glycosyl hydrolase [Streptomyces sp. NBC_01187]